MRLPRGLRAALTAMTCVAATACASGGAGLAGPAPSAPAPSADAGGTAAASGAYVEADVAFMRGMIHHHAQAVVMARMAPTHDAGPAVRRLAARILNSQKTEISLMADWLRDRGEPVPEHASIAGETAEEGGARETGGHDAHGAGQTGHGENPGPIQGWDEGPQMPGVLSDEQMAELDAASGEEFDRLFLTYMIDHHHGAVVMVDHLVQQPGAAREESVFRLASGIRADQSTEIERMRKMLREQMFGPGSRR